MIYYDVNVSKTKFRFRSISVPFHNCTFAGTKVWQFRKVSLFDHGRGNKIAGIKEETFYFLKKTCELSKIMSTHLHLHHLLSPKPSWTYTLLYTTYIKSKWLITEKKYFYTSLKYHVYHIYNLYRLWIFKFLFGSL